MNSKSELNELILETIDAHCKNEAVQELIHQALQYRIGYLEQTYRKCRSHR